MGSIRVKMFSGEIEDIDRQLYDFLEVEVIPPSHFMSFKLWDLADSFQAALIYEMLEVEYVESAGSSQENKPWDKLPERLDDYDDKD